MPIICVRSEWKIRKWSACRTADISIDRQFDLRSFRDDFLSKIELIETVMKSGLLRNCENKLLATLSPSALSLLVPHLKYREFGTGSPLWRARDKVDDIFFPHAGLISVAISTTGNHRIEIASIGREGAVGAFESIGNPLVGTFAIMQIAGPVSAISAREFAEAERKNDELMALAKLSCNWTTLQAQHLAVCSATHPAAARFCRWLLLAAKRDGRNMVPVTQEAAATLLGIRRSSLTVLAIQLKNAGVINYTRGVIEICNPKKLEAAACECYSSLDEANWPSTRLKAQLTAGRRH